MREGLKRWTVALDVLILLLAALLVRSWLVPDYRITFTPDFRISLTSWPRIALWLVVLVTIRYALVRDVPFHVRLAAWARGVAGWEPLRAAWAPFLVSRLMVLAVAYFAVVAVGFSKPPQFRALNNGFVDLYARWDAGWYFGIATFGYPTTFDPQSRSEIAFFPAFPLLMRAVAAVLDVTLWTAPVIIVIAAFLWALTYVYRLARLDMAHDQAKAALLFLAFYPFAVCYNAMLTEALFLLVAAAAMFHFRRDELWRAAAFAFVAGALRPNGFLLAIPLGLIAVAGLVKDGDRGRFVRQGMAASLPILGMAAYAIYLQVLIGNPLAWVEAQQAWGRSPVKILHILNERRWLIQTQSLARYVAEYPAEVLEGAAAVFALAATWPITRRFGLAYGLFVAMAVLPPLVSMGPVSLGRYTAPLFPIFLWLGVAVPPAHRPYWIAVFAAGQALVAVLFFTWRPPY